MGLQDTETGKAPKEYSGNVILKKWRLVLEQRVASEYSGSKQTRDAVGCNHGGMHGGGTVGGLASSDGRQKLADAKIV